MRVLFVWHAAVVEVYRKRLSELAKMSNIEILLLCPRRWKEGGRMVKYEPSNEGQKYYVRTGLTVFNFHPSTHLYIEGIFDAIEGFKPDIIHLVEEPYSLVTFEVILAKYCLKSNAKVIIESWQNIYKDYKFPFGFIEKFNLEQADALIAGNQEVKAVLAQKINKETFVIPLGVDIASYENIRKNNKRYFGNSFVVGYVGRVEWYKGIFTLLEAVKNMPSSLNIKLIVVGDGNALFKARQFVADHDMAEKVTFTGAISHRDVIQYLSSLDVLVLPSITTRTWKEQFGRVLIEAMACKIPVIGSSSGEIPNVIGNCGLVFTEGNSKDLMDKILMLAEDADYASKLGRLGYERVKSNYTWSAIAYKTYECYETVLEKRYFG